ncbi:hypothetical protein ESCAB7627_2236 [Escherichia albertii TW07627]|uniref:Uncharacterized protein n=1 Tax=Escherichia albertii (strain TW07627) TaxID=502347 RepID=A0ABC9NJE4_ESCAT|nr:hypothetical protein ESCAB7627_2236 [Escherichia albertii TW07627]
MGSRRLPHRLVFASLACKPEKVFTPPPASVFAHCQQPDIFSLLATA